MRQKEKLYRYSIGNVEVIYQNVVVLHTQNVVD